MATDTKRQCFLLGVEYGEGLGPNGNKALTIRAVEHGFSHPMDFVRHRARDLEAPEDYAIGVLTGIGVMTGAERFYGQ